MKFFSQLLGICTMLTALVAFTIRCRSLFTENINKTYFSIVLLGLYSIIHFTILNRFGFKEIDISSKSIKGLLFTSSILFIILSIGAIIPMLQEYNRKSKVEILSKVKDFGKDENVTTGTIGELKTKYQNDKLYYQVTLHIPEEQLDSIIDFSIQLLDIDGFVISSFTTSDNAASDERGKMLLLTINDNFNYSVQNYQKIAKWGLIVKRK